MATLAWSFVGHEDRSGASAAGSQTGDSCAGFESESPFHSTSVGRFGDNRLSGVASLRACYRHRPARLSAERSVDILVWAI